MPNRFGTTVGSIAALAACLASPLASAAADRATDGAVIVDAHVPGEHAMGAGTIIAQNGATIRVITADHVASFGSLTVRFEDGDAAAARILVEYPGNDLAIIEATLDTNEATLVHPVTVAAPRSNEHIHLWGSGYGGPALESAAITHVGADLPDGAPNGRFPIACDACHQGDSGGGIMDPDGNLVGVYVGYFEVGSERISVGEALPAAALKVARSNNAATVAFADTTAK